MALKIAIVGHTNSGKTTLIRTLLRRPIGEVDDRANVTQLSKSQEFKDLHANLVDTPGLQNAGGYLAFLRMREEHGDDAARTIKETIPLDYEEVVVRTIQKCDACIYVASLEFVPDDTMLAEIDLASSFCESLMVVLNKSREFARKDSKAEAERRKGLWIEGCERYEVKKVIDYDAHWASPSTTFTFFEEIGKILPAKKRRRFRQGVSAFKARQRDLRERAIEYALECVTKCRGIDLSDEMRGQSDETDKKYEARIKNRLTEMCGDDLSVFLDKATSLYALAAELPTARISNLGEFNPATAKMSRVSLAAGAAAFLAALFGVAGVLVGLLMASVTVVGAASVGGAVGGGLGAIVGFAGASGEQDKLRAVQAGYVAIICLNTLWILSCYGWGKGAKVPEDLLSAIDERTKQIVPGIDPINWHKASSDEMKKWIIRFLDRVDD
jgi:GTPase SAR1 family protein